MLRIIFLIFLFLGVSLNANEDALFEEFDNEFEEQKQETYDPLEPYNRVMTSFNNAFYLNVIEPVATGYSNVLPSDVRSAVSNAYDNILFPVRFVNNLLQLKAEGSVDELLRFVINSTVGVVGLADIAKDEFKIKPSKEDFGQTLGFYGASNDVHLVLPFLGPSNLRDAVGVVADSFASPLSYVKTDLDSIGLKMHNVVNDASHHPNEYRVLTKDAIDLYPFLKNIYEQRRSALIKE